MSDDEEERSPVGGEEANPTLLSLLLPPTGVVVMLLLDGVRLDLALIAEFTFESERRETMVGSDDVFLPVGKFLATSAKPSSASENSLGLLVCGVSGGTVRCRGVCSRTGDRRSWFSLSASELRALEAALTDTGEGRGNV